MGTQNKARVLLFDESDQGPGVEPVQRQTPFLKLPGAIKSFVGPPKQLRPFVHQLHIEIGIDPPENGIRIPEDLHMPGGYPLHRKGGDQGIRRPELTRGCCS